MTIVYALSPKGERECAADPPTLPAELSGLLRMVDGHRTRQDLLRATEKSALTAGGLRWLADAGYIRPASDAAPQPGKQGARPALTPLSALPSSAAPEQSRSEADVRQTLAEFMVKGIRRHLGEAGYPQRRQIERAKAVGDLLPHLYPLVDAILERVGSEAAAEFADTAAFILHPLERDGLLNGGGRRHMLTGVYSEIYSCSRRPDVRQAAI